jgi:hypothetical protein
VSGNGSSILVSAEAWLLETISRRFRNDRAAHLLVAHESTGKSVNAMAPILAGEHRRQQTEASRKLDKYVDKLAAYLPSWLCRAVKWLRAPERILARVVVSLLLIIGAVFSFLPVLGIWMLPLGLIIISQDLVFLQRPLATSFAWIERRWRSWRAPR